MPAPRLEPDKTPSVLMIGSEALPFSKTGGLADVLGALPLALARLGWDVTLVVPRYRGIQSGAFIERVPIPVAGQPFRVGYFETEIGSNPQPVRVVLVDAPDLFDRPGLYGADGRDYPDNARRFSVFTRAALEWVSRRGISIDIVHAHDWQTGLAPVYLQSHYAGHPVLGHARTVFTIHNLAYQGLFPAASLPDIDVPPRLFGPDGLEFWGQVSFLKAGINFSDAITTVSPRYAREIQTPAMGFGFDGILRERSDRLVGVLNGIDNEQWDPSRDPYLPATYSSRDLQGKAQAKTEVLRRYKLPRDVAAMKRPLIGMISRMVDQKGLDLIEALADRLPTLDATFAILGTGEPRYQEMWKRLAASHPTRIGVRVGFDEALAHVIEGGADLFLMPSRFEPCGLNQMYSLRYGTVPVVRRVGGLADTVEDGVTGFVFDEYSASALWATLQRALEAFGNPDKWRDIQRTGMKQDYSWDRSAREYVRIYERLSPNGG